MDWKQKVSKDVLQLTEKKPRAVISVIVQHRMGSSLPAVAGRLRVTKYVPYLSAFAAELTYEEIMSLAKQSEIVYISSNRLVSTCMNVARPAVGATLAQETGLDGRGIGVAVIDSGMYPHPDIGGAVDAYVDLTGDTDSLTDTLGHGTHVGGIILGRGNVATEYRGIAPAARLSVLRVFGADNFTTLDLILQAMGWVLDNSARYNIRVVNLSLGAEQVEPFDQDPICRASKLLWERGIVVVASAGNEGTAGRQTVRTPGSCPYCLTVGAVDDRRTVVRSDDVLALFSSQGPTIDGLTKPDCLAPGVSVISLRAPGSTLDRQLPQNRVGQWYFQLSGTSMAAPMVAGLAALILQQRPSFTPDNVKSTLLSTAEDKGQEATKQGMGYVNTLVVLRYLPSLSTSWNGRNLTVRFS